MLRVWGEMRKGSDYDAWFFLLQRRLSIKEAGSVPPCLVICQKVLGASFSESPKSLLMMFRLAPCAAR